MIDWLMMIMMQIDRYLLTQRERSNNCCNRQLVMLSRYCCLIGGKRYGNYLTVTYLLVKLAYLANVVCQLFLLEYWLGFDYLGFGVRAIRRALYGYEWHFGDSFPRVTLCAFQVIIRTCRGLAPTPTFFRLSEVKTMLAHRSTVTSDILPFYKSKASSTTD